MKTSSKRKFFYLAGVAIAFLCAFAIAEIARESPKGKRGEKGEIPIAIDLVPAEFSSRVIRFNIDESRIYAINIAFFYKKNDQGDRARVRALLDQGAIEKEGQSEHSIFIHASLYRINDNHLSILEKINFNSKKAKINSWGDDAFRKEVTSLRLESGAYELHVEDIVIEKSLSVQKIQLEIVKAYRGK